MVDAATGWCEVAPLIRDEAMYIAHAFFSEWVCRYGLPKAFLSDRGTEFLNVVLDILLKLMRVRRLLTSGYRPQTNGKVERLNAYINYIGFRNGRLLVCYPLLRVSHVNMRETQRVFPPSVPCLDGSQIDSLILFGVTRRLSPIR